MSEELRDEAWEVAASDGVEEVEGHSFYPYHVIETACIAYVVLGILVTLAVLRPFHLHEPADPLMTPPGIKPEWYFLPMYQGIKYVPPVIGVLASGGVFVAILFWPFVDALLTRITGWRRLYVLIGAIGLALSLGLGAVGYIAERTMTMQGQEYHFDHHGVPHAVEPDGENHGGH